MSDLPGQTPEAIGDAFQTAVAYKLREYEQRGLAAFCTVSTESRPAWNEDAEAIQFMPIKSSTDFYGALYPEGRCCAFDAKTTVSRVSWRLHSRMLHQWHRLRRLAAAHALCFFLVEARPLNRVYLLRIATPDPDEVPRIDFRLRPSEQDRPCIVVVSDHTGNYDFLPHVREAWLK